jgi:hypothetical protein
MKRPTKALVSRSVILTPGGPKKALAPPRLWISCRLSLLAWVVSRFPKLKPGKQMGSDERPQPVKPNCA